MGKHSRTAGKRPRSINILHSCTIRLQFRIYINILTNHRSSAFVKKHFLRLAENWQNKQEYSRKELIACLGSAFLLCQLGIEIQEQHITNATAYLKGWIKHLENNIEKLLEAAI